ncbi:MAG: HlyD family efflux transporter periplasmic adaptor subunit [Chloroflexota bacterium]
MRKKLLRIMLGILMAGSIAMPLVGCTTGQTTASDLQVAKVVRGSLTVDIVAGGNLTLSKKEDLAFKVAGTAAEVLVQEGETVTEGQVIARLDATPLEEAVVTAERAVRTADIDLETAEDGEFKIKTAEYDLETATNNFNKLNYPYAYATFTFEIPAAIESLSEAQRQLDEAREGITEGPGSEDYGDAMEKYQKAMNNLAVTLEKLSRGQSIDVWSSTNVSETVSNYQTARAALITMEKAQQNLEQTKRSVQSTLDKAELALEKAQDDLDQAREDLANAVITAPFDGFITMVSVAGGDEVKKGTIAVQIADPTRFEADIMVGEKDIFQVKEGGSATVQVDALPNIVLPAEVTHLAPTATVQSGVVNYEVKVEAESPQLFGQSGQRRQLSGGRGQSEQSLADPEATPIPVFQIPDLREGLSVTVNIIIAESNDVLMVPNGAITRSGRDIQVQVMQGSMPEIRSITTGISNWQYTEVTEGLAEGEEVVVPTTTAANSATSNQGQQRPFMIPGSGVRVGGSR